MKDVASIITLSAVLLPAVPLAAETVTATGTVESVDAKAGTITVRRKTANGEKTAEFKIARSTTILLEGRPAELRQFQPGQKVEIAYDTKAKQVTKLMASPTDADNATNSTEQVLFNGSNLDGWDGDQNFWSVEGGAILGRITTANRLTKSTCLVWRNGELDDFELRLSFKLDGGNSGVQYRSTDLGGHVVVGYQADIDADGAYTGALFEEGGRGMLAQSGQKTVVGLDHKPSVIGSIAERRRLQAKLKKSGWNEYAIIARGYHLQHFVNGQLFIDVTDHDDEQRKLSGVLALQLHAGGPMTVRFKDIRLKRLPREENIERSGGVPADGR